MRIVTALLLTLAIGTPASGQGAVTRQPAAPSQAPGTAAAPTPPLAVEVDAREVREQFEDLLRRYPPDLGRILKLDPTMLSNSEYLAQYPSLQQFLAAHPEIVRNPLFYLQFVQMSSDYTRPADPRSRALEIWNDVIEFASIFAVVVFVSTMIAWLFRMVLSHRRWLRTSRVQTEVHHKLLDRFANTNELLAYVQTPAARRFLEAEPVPIEAAGDRVAGAPLNRIMWSVQAGIVLVIGGFGFQYVSNNVMDEVSQGFWTLGVLATTFGLGFVAAGAFSFLISRRLGLLGAPDARRRSEHDAPAA